VRKHQEQGYIPLTFTTTIADFGTGVKPLLYDSDSFADAILPHERSIGTVMALAAALRRAMAWCCNYWLVWGRYCLLISW
jgi:hypothetical protein